MRCYIDLTILPDLELQEQTLLNALFEKLHYALVTVKNESIGVSFPKTEKKLGHVLRLHSDRENLLTLMATTWLKGFEDYVHVAPIADVPGDCSYRVVSRVQSKSNRERLYRRSIKKGWLTQEEAEKRLAEQQPECLSFPFLSLRSSSTGQHFRLYIKHGELVGQPVEGKFSCYGLSTIATIPWF